jgi:hypothetical protein
MMISLSVSSVLVVLSISISISNGRFHQDSNDKIKLVDIETLTFVAGKQTTARRGSPMPQLSCVRGPCNDASLVPVAVQCRNVGTDGVDVQWRCDADLDSRVKFGELQVSCEGYANPDDPYVLKGSCALEFELVRVGGGRSPENRVHVGDDSGGFSWPTILVFLLIGICICCAVCGNKQNPHTILAPETFQAPRYGVHSPDDLPPPSYQQVYGGTASQQNSGGVVGSGVLSHAAAGAAGFALGRATAPTNNYPYPTTTTTSVSVSSSSDSQHDTRQATGFATTKRR